MQVYRNNITYSSEVQPFHLIEKKGWEPSHIPGKQQFGIQTWCDRKAVIGKNDTYETLERKKHEKKLCKECVDMFKRMRKR